MIIQTLLHRIEGTCYKRPEDRVTDAINNNEDFIPLTDVTISSLIGEKIFAIDFLLINLNHVVWIFPKDEINCD